jgi:hypothetical protein
MRECRTCGNKFRNGFRRKLTVSEERKKKGSE